LLNPSGIHLKVFPYGFSVSPLQLYSCITMSPGSRATLLQPQRQHLFRHLARIQGNTPPAPKTTPVPPSRPDPDTPPAPKTTPVPPSPTEPGQHSSSPKANTCPAISPGSRHSSSPKDNTCSAIFPESRPTLQYW